VFSLKLASTVRDPQLAGTVLPLPQEAKAELLLTQLEHLMI
jgi:hypothetical protein